MGINDERVITTLLCCKTADDFISKYVKLHKDEEVKNTYTVDGAIDVEQTLSDIMAHEIDLNILGQVIWTMRPMYVRIEKMNRLINVKQK